MILNNKNVKDLVYQKLPTLTVDKFLVDAFNLRLQLSKFLHISEEELNKCLFDSTSELVHIHSEIFNPQEAGKFYESNVGTHHLLELASWHLSDSASYIADTLRLQSSFARGHLLDFGGGIATHALAAASMPNVEKVWFVDINPHNRDFAESRAKQLGLDNRFHCSRDLNDPALPKYFDTIICLDVLEHIHNPSMQLELFSNRMASHSIILLNWYFFKGFNKEYPFHFDDLDMVEKFFTTIQDKFLEIFHPYLITARAYRLAPSTMK